MLRELAALACGTLFGLGLAVSQMVSPAKVQGFLDLAGAWDPSLALVMAGALGVTFVGYRLVLGGRRPLLADKFHLPTARALDRRLIGGSALFGIGWGLVGFCPGPALSALAVFDGKIAAFVLAMVAGMLLDRLLGARMLAGRPGVA